MFVSVPPPPPPPPSQPLNGGLSPEHLSLASDHIARVLSYRFRDEQRLANAFLHASAAPTREVSYERLEFLGDAVLGLIVSQSLYTRYPGLLEGEMTKIKSSVVSRKTCTDISRKLALGQFLVLGKGMTPLAGSCQDPRSQDSLLAAVFESVLAAIYLDAGLDATARVLLPIIDPLIDASYDSGHQENYKSVLQQHAQQKLRMTPVYRPIDERGPDHAKLFCLRVELAGKEHESAWGYTKKEAEQLAALKALRELGCLGDCPSISLRLSKEPIVEIRPIVHAPPFDDHRMKPTGDESSAL